MSRSPRSLFDLYVERHFALGNRRRGFMFLENGDDYVQDRPEELFSEADLLSKHLRDLVAPQGGVVAILSRSQRTQVKAVLQCLAADLVPAVLTPPTRKIDPALYRASLGSVLDAVGPSIVVTDQIETVGSAAADISPSFSIYDSELQALASEGQSSNVLRAPEGTVMAQFSSGTTGVKKGVAISYDAMVSQLRTYGEALSVSPTRQSGENEFGGDCVVSWLPLYHDMGYITSLHLCLYAGVDSVLIDPFRWLANPVQYLQAVHSFGGTLGWHPNFAYAYMASRIRDTDLGDLDLGSLRSLVNCSEPVTDASQQAFLRRFEQYGLRRGTFTGCYAMAETTFALTHGTATDHEFLDIEGPYGERGLSSRLPIPTVGRSLPGVEIDIRDGDANTVQDHHTGEIWTRARFLASGYLGNQPATDAAFVDGWYRTGDLGYRIEDRYYVVGRLKDMLIVAGENVYPEDIERLISEDPNVRTGRVAAFALFDDRSQTEQVTALAEPTQTGTEPDVISLRQRLLAEIGVAVRVEIVDPEWLLKSSSGKISRSACREKWTNQKRVDG